MFYSKELLGKKAPLGAIWFAAHGKKLRKDNVLRVNIVKTCEKILDPEIPQALRLQGILIGGLTIIFGKQQYYLLEDCNEVMRKIQAAMVIDSGNTLGSNKRNARLEAITMADMEDNLPEEQFTLIGMPGTQGLNMEDDGLLPILTADQGGSHGDMDAGAAHDYHRLSLDPGLGLDFPYHTEQPEMFDLPGPDDGPIADLPDALTSPGANPDADLLPVREGDIPFELEAEPPQLHVENAEKQHQAPGAALSGLNAASPAAHNLPAGQNSMLDMGGAGGWSAGVAPLPEQEPQEQMQVRQAKQRSRKRKNALIVDDIERIAIHSSVFRQWMLDHLELLIPRPRKIIRQGADAGNLAKQPATANWSHEAWPDPLQSLFERRLVEHHALGAPQKAPPPGGQIGKISPSGGAPRQSSSHRAHYPLADGGYDDDFHIDQGLPAPDEDLPLYDGLPPEGPDFQDPVQADDLPIGDIDKPLIERMRAALESPDNGLDISLAQFNLGYTPDANARQPGARLGTGSRSRRRSVARPESDHTSDRSGSKERLEDLAEDADFLGKLAVEGDLDDLLPAVPEDDMEGAPPSSKRRKTGPGPLTQFQANGGSLLEDSAPHTQATPNPTMDQKTCAMLTVLQAKFKEQRLTGEESPSLQFSSLSHGLNRGQSARLFYQIMVSHGLGIIRVQQDKPYSDISIQAATLRISIQDDTDHHHNDDPDGEDDYE